MRGKLGCLFLFLAILTLSVPAHSQTATQGPPPTTLGVSPHYCGQATKPLYCYGIPLTANGSPAGTAWLDIYPNNTGFVVLNTTNPAVQTTVYITGATRTTNSIGQTTAITVTFAGSADPDQDGDTDTLTGSLTLSFNYVYVPTARFWLLYVTSGSATLSITS